MNNKFTSRDWEGEEERQIDYLWKLKKVCEQPTWSKKHKLSWLELCTGIAEVMGSIPVQAWIFSGFFFSTA